MGSDSGSGTKKAILFDYSDGTVSSERYKEDLRPLSDELDPHAILDVSGKAWTDKGRGNTALGFSADELNQVHDRLTRDTTLTEDDDWADDAYMEKWGYEYGDDVPNEPRYHVITAAHHEILRDYGDRLDTHDDDLADLRAENDRLRSTLTSLVAWATEQGFDPEDVPDLSEPATPADDDSGGLLSRLLG